MRPNNRAPDLSDVQLLSDLASAASVGQAERRSEFAGHTFGGKRMGIEHARALTLVCAAAFCPALSAETVFLDEWVIHHGRAVVAYAGPGPSSGVGLELAAMGRVEALSDRRPLTIWRVRNSSTQTLTLTLRSADGGWAVDFLSPAHTDNFLASDAGEQQNHELLVAEEQIAIGVPSSELWADDRLIPDPRSQQERHQSQQQQTQQQQLDTPI